MIRPGPIARVVHAGWRLLLRALPGPPRNRSPWLPHTWAWRLRRLPLGGRLVLARRRRRLEGTTPGGARFVLRTAPPPDRTLPALAGLDVELRRKVEAIEAERHRRFAAGERLGALDRACALGAVITAHVRRDVLGPGGEVEPEHHLLAVHPPAAKSAGYALAPCSCRCPWSEPDGAGARSPRALARSCSTGGSR